MKFAVVEYASKTGQIWQHTDARPNYLADPAHEIDPTSFGCYVSALKGAHIPLTGLIVGPVEGTSALARLYRKGVKRLTGSWPKSYSITPLRTYDALMVVHQLSDAHEIVGLLQRLRVQKTRPFIIGVPTQPYGILKDAVEKDARAANVFSEFMSLCDVFLTLTQAAAPWYQQRTNTPTVYLPQPYPAAFASQYAAAPQDKSKQILVAGVTQRDNIKRGQLVAARLQAAFPDYEILVPKVADLAYDTANLKGVRYRLLPFEQWREHLRTLSLVKLVVNTDYTFTRGRVQTDCAAVGTPSIGANSDAQRDLFPVLYSAAPVTVEQLVAEGTALLRDAALYQSVTQAAAERLRNYDYTPSAARLEELIATHRR